MPDCSRIDPLVTPFVDDELSSHEHEVVAAHLAACAECHARVTAERGARSLLKARRLELERHGASPALRARCAALRAGPAASLRRLEPPAAASRRRAGGVGPRLAPLALAASLVLVVGGAFLYQATRLSSRVMAAELAADHMKCFTLNGLARTSHSHERVEASMASRFGWSMQLPQAPASEDLELVGSRPCLYGEGPVAHIMFTHKGQPLSLFMLPRETREETLVDVFGLNCRVWSMGSRTFVLVSPEPAPEVERLATMVRASLH
ncbi:MAG: anti-sigma factor [Vicinamibacterales bacterium]